jgi:hypothetical protein
VNDFHSALDSLKNARQADPVNAESTHLDRRRSALRVRLSVKFGSLLQSGYSAQNPVVSGSFVNKLIRVSRQLVQELGREPRSAEIAKQMDIPEAKVRRVLKIMQVPISLETPIGEEGDSHLSDFIADRAVVSPAEAVINVDLKEQTARVLHTLSVREEKVVKMRFGLEDGSEHTLEEVGLEFAVTRERIRQIEAKALPQAAPPVALRQAQVTSRRRARMTPGFVHEVRS